MRASLPWGIELLEADVDEKNLIQVHRAPIAPDLADPVAALRYSLEHPIDYPPLRLALTPDDQVAIVVDEGIPHLGRLLTPLLAHIGDAHVRPEAITLVCAQPSSGQPWLDDLPDAFQDVRIEVHQPGDRRKLAYLATTKDERRVYLNRTVVDADQVVVLTRRGYDPLFGYSGAETAMYPGVCDAATTDELCTEFEHKAPGKSVWPIQQTARDVAWLSGAPFFVQVIPGGGNAISHIVSGPLDSSDAGQRLLDDRWRIGVDRPADVVLASITGDGSVVTVNDLAQAVFAASRVVVPGGSIALLTDAAVSSGPGFEILRRVDDPAEAIRHLLDEKPIDLMASYQWASAAERARLYLLGGWKADVTEELFAIPVDHAEQVRKLVATDCSVLLMPDAHRTLAVLD